MGRVGAPHGVKGWVKVLADSSPALARHARWWIGADGKWEEVDVADTALHGATLVARLAGCEDRDAAAQLRGRDVALPREMLPATGPGEYYWTDLIGLEVVNADGASLGTVTGLFSNGAHDVMRVSEGKCERLLPFVATVIRGVDLAGGRIDVEWGADW
jgi:16S rRNA processing protein RimM